MSRDAKNKAKKAFGETQDLYKSATGSSNQLMNELNPYYKHEMTNPQGLTPEDLNASTTAIRESTGGSDAGAVSAENLNAAHTRNSAGVTTAEDTATRNATRTGAQEALQLKETNALQRERHREEG